MFYMVQIRSIALAAGIALCCSACANDTLGTAPMQLGGSSALASDGTTLRGSIASSTNDVKRKRKKTQSDKMLAASALERATGRKPDPRRFHIFKAD